MPIWKLVLDAGIPLSEVSRWDLEDVYKALSYMEMRQDYDAANTGFDIAKTDKLKEK